MSQSQKMMFLKITLTIFSQANFPSMKPFGIAFGVNNSYLNKWIQE